MKKTDDQTKKQLEEAKAQADELKSKYIRAIADYQNLEKRTREQLQQARAFAAEIMLEQLFPVLDTLIRAQSHLNDAGLALAIKEFEDVLSTHGVSRIETVGREFDPKLMECIEVVAGEENIVTDEVLAGYRLGEKVLRVARVKVGKQASEVL